MSTNNGGSEFTKGLGVGAGYAAAASVLGLVETAAAFLIQNPEMMVEAKEKYYGFITPPEGIESRVWK